MLFIADAFSVYGNVAFVGVSLDVAAFYDTAVEGDSAAFYKLLDFASGVLTLRSDNFIYSFHSLLNLSDFIALDPEYSLGVGEKKFVVEGVCIEVVDYTVGICFAEKFNLSFSEAGSAEYACAKVKF